MTTKLVHLLRRTSVTVLAGALVLALAGPATAADGGVPEGFSDPEPVDTWHALLVLGGLPLLLFVLIAAFVMLPGLIRGERVASGGQGTEEQWFGGPRKGTTELPAPDNEESKAGGASGRW